MAGIQTSQITTKDGDNLSLNPAGTGKVVLPDLAGSGEVPMSVDTSGNVKPLDEREFDQLTAVDPGDKIMVQRGTGYYYVDATDLGGLGLADPNPPTDIEWSPSTPPGSGTKGDPYVLTPATVNAPGGGATSVESCRIINQKPDSLVLTNEIGGQVGSRMDQPAQICGNDGKTEYFNFGYLDAPNTTIGTDYDGLMRIGNSSIYVKWVVTQVANKTVFGPEQGAPNASPQSVSYPFDSKYGKGSATWADGSKTLSSTGDLVFGVNGSGLSSSNKSVSNGDTVQIGYVEATVASAAEGAAITGNLVSTDNKYKSVHTMVKDVTPTPFSISPLVDAPTSTQVTTGNNPIKGVNAPTTISLTSATLTGVELSVAGAAFSSGPWTFNPGDSLQARGTTGATINTGYNAVFDVGGVSVTWNVTTTAGNPAIAQPIITTPANGSTDIAPDSELVSTDYTPLDGAGTHQSSDWEVYEAGETNPTIGPITQVGTTTGVDYSQYVTLWNTTLNREEPDGDPEANGGTKNDIFDANEDTYYWRAYRSTSSNKYDLKFIFTPPNPIIVQGQVEVKCGFANNSRLGVMRINGEVVLELEAGGSPYDPQWFSVSYTGEINSIELEQKYNTETGTSYPSPRTVSVNAFKIDGEYLVSNKTVTYLDFANNTGFGDFSFYDYLEEVDVNGNDLGASGNVGEVSPSGFPNRITLVEDEAGWSAGNYLANTTKGTSITTPPTTDPPSADYALVDSSYNDTSNLTTYTPGSPPLELDKTYFSRVKYRDNGSSGSTITSQWSNWNQMETGSPSGGGEVVYPPLYWTAGPPNELNNITGLEASKKGPGVVLLQSDGTTFYTTDGTNWTTSTNLVGRTTNGFGSLQASENRWVCKSGEEFFYSDDGNTWEQSTETVARDKGGDNYFSDLYYDLETKNFVIIETFDRRSAVHDYKSHVHLSSDGEVFTKVQEQELQSSRQNHAGTSYRGLWWSGDTRRGTATEAGSQLFWTDGTYDLLNFRTEAKASGQAEIAGANGVVIAKANPGYNQPNHIYTRVDPDTQSIIETVKMGGDNVPVGLTYGKGPVWMGCGSKLWFSYDNGRSFAQISESAGGYPSANWNHVTYSEMLGKWFTSRNVNPGEGSSIYVSL